MEGKLLRAMRISAGLTQQRLAKRVSLPRLLIDYFERGVVTIAPETVARLSEEIAGAARRRK